MCNEDQVEFESSYERSIKEYEDALENPYQFNLSIFSQERMELIIII